MSFECELDDGRLAISGELTVYTAPELKERVLKQLKRRQRPPLLDLSGVAEIDTAGVQVLLLAKRYCEATGGQFEIDAASDAVRDALQLCGLDRFVRSEAEAAS